jgi:hypothetical protein
MMKKPGQIQVSYAPDGEAGSGGAGAGGSGASATTPTSTPEPSQASSTPSSPSGAAPSSEASPTAPQPLTDQFEGFGFESDEDDFSPSPEVATAPAAPKEQQTQPPPAQTPDPATQAPPQQPAAPTVQTGPQGQQPQFPTHAEPARIADALTSNIDDLVGHLAKSPEFQLSEVEIEAINTDVTTAIPQLLAKAHVRAQASALRQMEQVIPAIMQRFMTAERARSKSEGAFYSRWPDLNPAAHGDLVNRFAATYRRMNPQASREQLIEEIGPMVMMAAKVAPSMMRPANGGVAPQNGAPARRQPPPSPFQPAVGGSAAPPAAASEDPWEGFGALPPEED